MAFVGYNGVANQVNTTDGFGIGVVADNDPADLLFGEDVGDGGVVDLYHNSTPTAKFYIADETGVGTYVLQETGFKIVLESS